MITFFMITFSARGCKVTPLRKYKDKGRIDEQVEVKRADGALCCDKKEGKIVHQHCLSFITQFTFLGFYLDVMRFILELNLQSNSVLIRSTHKRC